MRLTIAVSILFSLGTLAVAQLKLMPAHPDENPQHTFKHRFSMKQALTSLEYVRASLESFRKLTEASKGKVAAAKLKEIGHTDWESQNLGIPNHLGSIEGTLRKQDYTIAKLEFELAKAKKELGRIEAEEVEKKKRALAKAEKEFQKFWDKFGIAD